MRVYLNKPLSRYTTFNIGGPASLFVIPSSEAELMEILYRAYRYSVPYYILGNGSNILVNDLGVRGIVIKLGPHFSRFSFKGEVLIAGGGVDLATIRREAWKRGLSGLEFTAGIPGTLGGAIVMNAGGDSTIGDVVVGVEIMDEKGRIKWLSYRDIDFGYRSVSIGSGIVILRAELHLKATSPLSIEKEMSSIWRKKKKYQPVGEKSAGSIFKNPAGYKMTAGQLIEKAGLKGMSCGRAYISPLHANFIINKGGARAEDITNLIKIVQAEVFRKFRINLELEVVLW